MKTHAKRPNILVIMSDDQGAWSMGCAGNTDLVTPNLDALAGTGTRFANFFCTSPVCSPARASFLTGTIPSRHGVHDWIKSGNIDVEDGVTWCGADRPIEYLRGQTGFTDILAANGYRCGLSGKWHLGDSARPQKGHTFWSAHSLGGDHYMNYHVFENSPRLENKTQYVTDYFTDGALSFLDSHGTGPEPFCLSVHYTAPHAPWSRDNHPDEYLDLYRDCRFESFPVEPPHPWRGWDPKPDARREALTGYCAAVTAMDAAIGRILGKLDALGIRENTVVVFLADNGMNMGHHGICGKGNGTFPLNMYDTSVKIPFIISRPGSIPGNTVCDGLYSQYDFMPTILDYLGFEFDDSGKLPGRSFADVLRGGKGTEDEHVTVFDEYGPTRMIRTGEWKYVHRYPYGPHELYDLAGDPGETKNLVDDESLRTIRDRLRGTLADWFVRFADPAVDGTKEAVTGKGQIDRAGTAGDGRTAFV